MTPLSPPLPRPLSARSRQLWACRERCSQPRAGRWLRGFRIGSALRPGASRSLRRRRGCPRPSSRWCTRPGSAETGTPSLTAARHPTPWPPCTWPPARHHPPLTWHSACHLRNNTSSHQRLAPRRGPAGLCERWRRGRGMGWRGGERRGGTASARRRSCGSASREAASCWSRFGGIVMRSLPALPHTAPSPSKRQRSAAARGGGGGVQGADLVQIELAACAAGRAPGGRHADGAVPVLPAPHAER
jgi:hypothetical protein